MIQLTTSSNHTLQTRENGITTAIQRFLPADKLVVYMMVLEITESREDEVLRKEKLPGI